jgi:hypothetical protein
MSAPERIGCDDVRMPARGLLALALAVAAAGALAGCSSTQDAEVEETASRFYAALEANDGGTACQELAPRTRSEVEQSAQKPCAEAILDEDIPAAGERREVATFGTAAQVRYGDETTFLSRFQDGWHVVAAGCTPLPSGRYDCQVEAG